ncbi:hypothetical protein H0H92_012142 [Tricholoma furcatifolium]|nr:hypothetical protein H0H92_012142 [Tricholoma furcatifolium]
MHRTAPNPTAKSPTTSPLTESPLTSPTPPGRCQKGEPSGLHHEGLTDEQKIAVFELSLVEGGPAKEWFDELTGDDKATWAGLMTVFDTRWPARVIVTKTTAEKQDNLRQHILKEADLLQKQELMDGREAYSYVVWAEKALYLAKLIPDMNYLLVSQS